jgi:radical SAM superfamily enzyme YgiQ (UPF0313 family)
MRFIDDIYEGSIYRPPSEARSLILQATIGCSHNKCTFCGTFMEKKFRIKSLQEIESDIKKVKPYYKSAQRIFLADGNALIIPTKRLLKILKMLTDNFPKLERVGIYGSPSDVLRKSPEELKQLKDAGLGIIYIGLESGNDEILNNICKGATAADMIESARKVKESGIVLSVIMILGIGGRKNSRIHAEDSGKVVSQMDPEYLGALTLMVVKGTEIARQVDAGEFELLKPRDIFQELLTLIENLDVTNCVFRANHASNYLTFGGTLPAEKQKLIDELKDILSQDDISVKHEWFRAL